LSCTAVCAGASQSPEAGEGEVPDPTGLSDSKSAPPGPKRVVETSQRRPSVGWGRAVFSEGRGTPSAKGRYSGRFPAKRPEATWQPSEQTYLRPLSPYTRTRATLTRIFGSEPSPRIFSPQHGYPHQPCGWWTRHAFCWARAGHPAPSRRRKTAHLKSALLHDVLVVSSFEPPAG
jgi:hypothetical protein